MRTLRRHHDAGLLEPATVDDVTGYRDYGADRIPTARVIHRLREPDVPSPDVQRILRTPDRGTPAPWPSWTPWSTNRPVPRVSCTTTRCSRTAAGTCSCTDVGEHDDIAVTYGELGAWAVADAPAVGGPVRETYLAGPRDTPDPSARRTEIGWPVFRVAPR